MFLIQRMIYACAYTLYVYLCLETIQWNIMIFFVHCYELPRIETDGNVTLCNTILNIQTFFYWHVIARRRGRLEFLFKMQISISNKTVRKNSPINNSEYIQNVGARNDGGVLARSTKKTEWNPKNLQLITPPTRHICTDGERRAITFRYTGSASNDH